MISSLNTSNEKDSLRDWSRAAVRWGIVPGWLLSVVFHVLSFVILLSVTQWPSCRGDFSGEEGTGFREIGLRARGDGDGHPEGSGTQAGVKATDSGESQAPQSPVDDIVSPLRPIDTPDISNEPPIDLAHAEQSTSRMVLGGGPPLDLALLGGAPSGSQLAGSSEPGGGKQGPPGSRGDGGIGLGDGHGTGQTSLFGVNDAGKKFVYVIDRSFSMDEYGAFRAAKAELLTSLSRLTEVQQFQVIFYNNEPLMLATREDRHHMFFGTDTQRLQVAEQIRAISPDGGTRHLPAVIEALKLNPDVIFLLTDAATELDRSEVESIKARNRQGTRIHCIEFGKGAPPKTPDGKMIPNFLTKLAEQNSGKYSYRDVRQFSHQNE